MDPRPGCVGREVDNRTPVGAGTSGSSSQKAETVDSAAVSARISEFVAGLQLADVPHVVTERLKKSVLDVLASALYGSRIDSIAAPLEYVRSRGGPPQSTIWYYGDKVPLFEAALMNGTMINASEYQEGFSRAMAQPEVGVVPGLMALAERERKSGADFLTAAAAGYELLIRFGFTLAEPAVFYQRQGLTAPAVFGPLGSAASGSRLLGWSPTRVADAMGIASVLTPTPPLVGNHQSATVKDMYQGFGTAFGMMAVDLAAVGVTGLRDWVLPWYRAVVQGYTWTPLIDRLGAYWHISSGGLHIKSKPLLAMSQPVLSSLEQILKANVIDVEDIDDILAESSRRIELSDIPVPTTMTGARASIQFMVAAALVHQKEFTTDPYLVRFLTPSLLNDEDVRRLAKRVRLGIDPEFDFNMDFAPTEDGDHYMKFEGRITLTLRDGRKFTAYEDVYAHNGNPTRERIEAKFRACADGKLPAAQQDRVIETVWQLESLKDIGELVALMLAR